jgi:hypothetical protein
MDWIEKIVEIRTKLSENGFERSASNILNAQLNLGSPGEMFLEVMNVILKIKNDKLPDWEIIKEDADELFKYGRDIGYFVI